MVRTAFVGRTDLRELSVRWEIRDGLVPTEFRDKRAGMDLQERRESRVLPASMDRLA